MVKPRLCPLIGLLLCLVPLLAQAADGPAPEFPQVKIDRVDAINPSKWRVFMTLLGEGGQPLNLMEHNVALFLTEGKGPVRTQGVTPIAKFSSGLADKGFDGRMSGLAKADLKQAVVFVVALHTDVGPEVRTLLGEAMATVLEGLRKDARVGVLFYNDRIMTLWSPDGARAELRDLNDYQNCLFRLRREVVEGGDPKDQSVACGRLFPAPDLVKEAAKAIPPGQGLFPRLFGIPDSAEVTTGARERGHTRMDETDILRGEEFFAAGAIEAALRILEVNSSPSDLREVIVLSDGRDGYMRVADLMSDHVAPACRKQAKQCTQKGQATEQPKDELAAWESIPGMDHEGGSKGCTREVLACAIPKVADALRVREEAVRDYLVRMVYALRAAGVRVSSIAIPGSDEVGRARLQALALKTGGTFRAATATSQLKASSKALSLELASQIMVTPDESLDPEALYAIAATVSDLGLIANGYGFVTGKRVLFFAGPLGKARAWVIGKLGHTWGPIVFWVALVLAVLAAIFFVYMMGKMIVGMIKGAGKKAAGKVKGKFKPPAAPKLPGVKPPAVKPPAVPKVPGVKPPAVKLPGVKLPPIPKPK